MVKKIVRLILALFMLNTITSHAIEQNPSLPTDYLKIDNPLVWMYGISALSASAGIYCTWIKDYPNKGNRDFDVKLCAIITSVFAGSATAYLLARIFGGPETTKHSTINNHTKESHDEIHALPRTV